MIELQTKALIDAAPELYRGARSAAETLTGWADILEREAAKDGSLFAEVHRDRAQAYRDVAAILAPGIEQAERRPS